jgi:integrase
MVVRAERPAAEGARVARGSRLGAGSEATVGSYLAAWLGHAKARVRARTPQGYKGLIHLYAIPHLGEITLEALQPLDIQDAYVRLLEREPPLSAGTVLNLHLVLHNALGQAVRWGLIPANPVAGAQPPRPKRREPRVVDAELARRILAAAEGTTLEVPTAIALATGMRRGEILGLRWSDLDRDLTVAHVRRTLQTTNAGPVLEEPKTRRSRRAVALPSFLRPYLLRQRADQESRRKRLGADWQEDDAVVDSGDGSPLSPDALSAAWPRFLTKAELPHVRFHDLRHAHATLMLLQGVHPKIVSERLGHASIGITLDTYSHVLPGMQGEAAIVFDELFKPS